MAFIRDKQFDGLKFILIFLVVWGHITNPNYDQLWTTRFIYSFHMPVFIFLSGYFSSTKISWENLWKWTKKIMLIYLIAQTIHNGLAFIICKQVERSRLLYIEPQFAMWYLMSLVFWRYSLKLVADKLNDHVILGLSFVLAVLVGFIPINTVFSFQRNFTFLPFFVLGYVFKKHGLIHSLEKKPYWLFIIIFLVSMVGVRYLPIYMPNKHYGSIPIFLAQTILGLVLCVTIIRLSRIKLMEYFADYGKYTLWIYIGHTFLVVIQNAICAKIGLTINVWMSLILSAIYVVLITAVAIQYNKIRVH